jgi:hypothetical protein
MPGFEQRPDTSRASERVTSSPIVHGRVEAQGEDSFFSAAALDGVRAALSSSAARDEPDPLHAALAALCGEAHRRGYPAERVVISLKQAWRTARRPTLVPPSAWETLYQRALSESLELFFEERGG